MFVWKKEETDKDKKKCDQKASLPLDKVPYFYKWQIMKLLTCKICNLGSV